VPEIEPSRFPTRRNASDEPLSRLRRSKDDAFLHGLAIACPKLAVVRLFGWDIELTVTLRGLANFARQLPHLVVLGKTFTSGNLAIEDECSEASRNLEELQVGDSRTAKEQEEADIAAFLSKRFPKLSMLEFDGFFRKRANEELEERWNRVRDLTHFEGRSVLIGNTGRHTPA
jgi:hypothetical protein